MPRRPAGQPVEAFVEQDAVSACRPITEADVAQFYEQNKDRAQGRTLDQLRGEIKPFLEARREQQARAMLVEDLKPKNAGTVKVMLEPPRYTVPTSADDPVRGNAAAPVTIVEFSDYQCPFCARVNPTLAKVARDLRRSRQDRVQGLPAAEPSRRRRRPPKPRTAPASRRSTGRCTTRCSRTSARCEVPALKQTARAIGLDGAAFDQCLDSGKYAATVRGGTRARREDGRELDADALHQRPRR